MNKTAIKNFAVWARRKLISEIIYKASLVGISEKGISTPLPTSTDNIQFFDIGTGKPTEIANEEVKQRAALVSRIKDKEKTSDYKTAFAFVMEEVAYTWFNRLVAIRFMEVNEYLPSKIRVLSSEMSGKAEPDMVTTPFDTDMEFSAYETDRIMQLKDENKLDELFRMLFIKQCNKLNEVLPELFEKTSDYTEYILNISFTDKDGIVSHLVNDIVEDDFKEAVEIIGWLYQYYNTEPKEKVFANLKKNIKISKDNIPAATQLFTPDWIVRYMVENSLGRLWVEGHENDSLKAKWNYYLDEAEQEESVKAELKKIRADYKNIKLEEIKLIDPCMGSGHILVYAFDVFMQIYESQGYTERDAAQSIIENNIYGLDIDERAYQLAYFALIMKARKYDRRFLTRGIAPQVYCPKGYADGEDYGSLLQVDELENKPQEPAELTLFNMDWEKDINTWNFRRLLNQKYDVVVTNPPYMGGSGMSAKLSDFVKKNYPDSKSDMFACFIEKGNKMLKSNGYNTMVTMQSWMFLSSFEKMRETIISTKTISNLMHMENMVMGIAFGTAVANIRNAKIKGYKGTYNHITMKDIGENGEPTEFPVKENRFAQVSTENFSKIPGSPIAYWVSEKMLSAFERGINLKTCGDTRQGMATSDNNRFLRLWTEIDFNKLGLDCDCAEEAKKIQKKWFPYNKGGEFRKWYGNIDYTINYENDGAEVKGYATSLYKTPSRTIKSISEYFKPCLSWSKISSGSIAFRYYPKGFIFDVAGCCIFYKSEQKMLYDFAFINSKISKNILSAISPTLNYEAGHIASLPILDIAEKSNITDVVSQNIALSKADWDSFETSWDFKVHPLVQSICESEREKVVVKYNENGMYADTDTEIYISIENAFNSWKNECEQRFNTLKANEEELNRIFIDIYGLQDELTPKVEDKDVTVNRIFNSKEEIPESMKGSKYAITKQDVIKSFVSYAVGCMFGRYSLDVDGLAYAGGDWDDSKYKTFIPDTDNVIPITDEEYFADDIMGLFVAFVKKVYGEDTLEENLDFIAKALGNKGDTSREVIRNYFVKDFYKDHVKTYQKRPIYWLYDSGKQDGFKALVYMHRYNADTTGKVRVDYLHKMQRTYMSEIERMQDMIDNSTNPREVAQSEKRKEKLVKQLKETKDYDEKIAHLALSRIAIDLDDGVKVNYDKVQTAQDGKKLDVLGKI